MGTGALVRLRKHLGMDPTVKIFDRFQVLGEVNFDLVEKFHVDLFPIGPESIYFEHLMRWEYEPWTLFDGTQVLMPGAFDVTRF
jgi:hypothetical protein